MTDIVHVENLVKRYDDLIALDHFSLSIAPGEIFGLLGPNGSGKTTSINCILQLLAYDKGTIELFGEPMTPARYDLKRRIGVVPQQVAVFDELTVRENIDYFCSLYVNDRKRRRALVDEAIDFVGLGDFTKFRPGKLSGGLARRLNIACGIAHKPELIFFDEPTVAVDPQSRNAILEGICRLRDEGATVVYTSHYMEEVEQICSRIMIMDGGRVLAQGTNDELKRMIQMGERVTVEVSAVETATVERLRALEHVLSVELSGGELVCTCEASPHNLVDILDTLRAADVERAADPQRRVPRDHRPRAARLGDSHVQHHYHHGQNAAAPAEHVGLGRPLSHRAFHDVHVYVCEPELRRHGRPGAGCRRGGQGLGRFDL